MAKLSSEQRQGVSLLLLIVVIVALTTSLLRRESRVEVFDVVEDSVAIDLPKSVVSEFKESQQEVETKAPFKPILSPFDPNTVELSQLLEMGLTKSQAVSLLRYRASGKVFRIKEELIECYAFTDSLYFALEPYIVIGEEYKYKPKQQRSVSVEQTPRVANVATQKRTFNPRQYRMDTVTSRFFVEIGALTSRQAEVLIKWRDMSGIYDIDDLRECFVIDDTLAVKLHPYTIYQEREPKIAEGSINLNRVDSATLVKLEGIGSKSAQAIVRYRELLGGYHSVTQLFEIPFITEDNFSRFYRYFFVDLVDISKIDINFASAEELGTHPYFTQARIRRLLKKRKIKGGWSSIDEIVDDDIFTKKEAQHVQPYLDFNPISKFYNSQDDPYSR